MVSLNTIKILRERTGSGIMDCKKALKETNGDVDLAVEYMRKTGLAKAEKKSIRTAAEGIVKLVENPAKMQLGIIEINSETDFVAMDENFLKFADIVSQAMIENEIEDIDKMLQIKIGTETIDEMRKSLVAKVGENIQIRRAKIINYKEKNIGTYKHGTRIVVAVVSEGGNEEITKNIAMHIAASRPLVIQVHDLPVDIISKEREIYTEQYKDSNKPENIIEKIIDGKVNKFANSICLEGQQYVKDPSLTINEYLNTNNTKVTDFIRYELGEGIEVKKVNFADEVHEQIKSL